MDKSLKTSLYLNFLYNSEMPGNFPRGASDLISHGTDRVARARGSCRSFSSVRTQLRARGDPRGSGSSSRLKHPV